MNVPCMRTGFMYETEVSLLRRLKSVTKTKPVSSWRLLSSTSGGPFSPGDIRTFIRSFKKEQSRWMFTFEFQISKIDIVKMPASLCLKAPLTYRGQDRSREEKMIIFPLWNWEKPRRPVKRAAAHALICKPFLVWTLERLRAYSHNHPWDGKCTIGLGPSE